MDRLTFYDTRNKPCYKIGNSEHTNAVAERLAAYEDTGLTPEEIIKLKELKSKKCRKNKDITVKEYNKRLRIVLSIIVVIFTLSYTFLCGSIEFKNTGSMWSGFISGAITFVVFGFLFGLAGFLFYKTLMCPYHTEETKQTDKTKKEPELISLCNSAQREYANHIIGFPLSSFPPKSNFERLKKQHAFESGKIVCFVDAKAEYTDEFLNFLKEKRYKCSVITITPNEKQTLPQDDVCYSTD